MSTPKVAATNTERERQQQLTELAAEHGPDWQEQYKPGSFGCHELLDRAALLADMVEEQVLCHPSCALNPSWYALAEQAAAALRELYRSVGAEHMAGENSGGDP